MTKTRPFDRHAEGGRSIGDADCWWRYYKAKKTLLIGDSPFSSFPATLRAGLIP